MEIYAVFDPEGLPKGFFTPVVHESIPEDAVRISVKQWHEFIAHKGMRRWDGEKPVECAPVEPRAQACSRSMWRLLYPIAILRNKLIHLPR